MKAKECDPASAQISVELSRVQMYSGDYDEADEAIEQAIASADITMLLKRKAYDVWLQVAFRRSDKHYELGDYEKSLEGCEDVVNRFNEIPENFIDEKLVATVRRALPTLNILKSKLAHEGFQHRIQKCEERLNSLQSALPPRLFSSVDMLTKDTSKKRSAPALSDVSKAFEGVIISLWTAKKYGFIGYEENKAIFFHFSNVLGNPVGIGVGAKVTFIVEQNGDKFRAMQVARSNESSQMQEASESGGLLRGVVKNVPPGKNFGFIYADDGCDYYFNKANLDANTRLEDLKPGERVTFRVGKKDQQTFADEVHRC